MTTPATSWFEPFVPRRWISNGHVMTILGNYLPRTSPLPEAEALLIEVDKETGSRVLCHCHWQPEEVRQDRLTVVLVHGLEGSSTSQYILGNAMKMWTAGLNVVRMNMRNCGGTDELSPTLYHSGLSGDVGAVVDEIVRAYGLRSVALVGYSMGGNLVLKLAGDLGDSAPPQLKAVAGVSPAIDLAASADALSEGFNRLYEWKFLTNLKNRIRRKAKLFPKTFSIAGLDEIRTLRDFDDRITARYSGFAGAKDYYFRAAAARVVDRIAIPALILHAVDDPFIRLTKETRAVLQANPYVTLIETQFGGHCAFLAPQNSPSEDDGYWAEKVVLGFLLEAVDRVDKDDKVNKLDKVDK